MFGCFAKEVENQNNVYVESFELVNPNFLCKDFEFQEQVFKRTVNLLKNFLSEDVKNDFILKYN